MGRSFSFPDGRGVGRVTPRMSQWWGSRLICADTLPGCSQPPVVCERENNPRTCHMGKLVKASFRETINERKTCFLWRASQMRLKQGLGCQTLCATKSWLFRAGLCISCQGQHGQWLCLHVPSSAVRGWPSSSFPGPRGLLRLVGHPGIVRSLTPGLLQNFLFQGDIWTQRHFNLMDIPWPPGYVPFSCDFRNNISQLWGD